MHKLLLLLPCLLLLEGCNNQNVKPIPDNTAPTVTEMPAVNDGLQRFLDQFPEISLPAEIKACELKADLKALNNTISKPYTGEGGYVFGKFPLKGPYIGVITLLAADCFLPVLTTYTLSGKRISSEHIAIGYCDDGPCYKCEEVMVLRKDLTIYVADTMQTFNCDEDQMPVGEALTTEITYKEGRINKDGTIILSSEKKKKQV